MEQTLEKAKKHATRVLQLSHLADMSLKDYEFEINKLGYSAKQKGKMLVKQNIQGAQYLHSSLGRIEEALLGKVSDKVEDSFLDDVGLLYNLIKEAQAHCDTDEEKWKKVMEYIKGM
jgi:hypothetical protein